MEPRQQAIKALDHIIKIAKVWDGGGNEAIINVAEAARKALAARTEGDGWSSIESPARYSEEDMRKAMDEAIKIVLNSAFVSDKSGEILYSGFEVDRDINKYIQSLPDYLNSIK
jgi:hypothetical protein